MKLQSKFKIVAKGIKKFFSLTFQPIVIIGVLYGLWLTSVPMDFTGEGIYRDYVFVNFLTGVRLFIAYTILEVIAIFSVKNWILGVSKLIVVMIGSFLSTIPVLNLIWFDVRNHPVFIIFTIITGIFLVRPLVKVNKKAKNKQRWLNIASVVALAPLLYANISYLTYFNPQTSESKFLGNKQYTLVYTSFYAYFDDFVNGYECTDTVFSCSRIYHNNASFFPNEVIVDNERNEVHFVNRRLAHIYCS